MDAEYLTAYKFPPRSNNVTGAGKSAMLLRIMQAQIKLQLSPYVLFRSNGDVLLLEQPLSRFIIPLRTNSIVSLILRFIHPTICEHLLKQFSPEQKIKFQQLIELLKDKQVLISVDAEKSQDIAPLEMWELHNILFHTQSRHGLNLRSIGATYRFGSRDNQENVKRKSEWTGQTIDLITPDNSPDDSFTLAEALEQRRSTYHSSQISLSDLSDFLFYSLRVKSVTETDSTHPTIRKFYPSGGALHSLEIYLAAINCRDLGVGVYYYDGFNHRLISIPEQEDLARSIGEGASASMGQSSLPAAVIVFSSRFGRVFWKYESIGYRLLLIELGTVFQTLHLVASRLKLSVCIVGSGNSSEFSEKLGLNYFRETSIGEFVINGKF